jgi:hypothetical protein
LPRRPRARRLQVGSLVINRVKLRIMERDRGGEPGGGADLVLGEDLLSRYTAEFDLSHGIIRLLTSVPPSY